MRKSLRKDQTYQVVKASALSQLSMVVKSTYSLGRAWVPVLAWPGPGTGGKYHGY